MAMYHAGRLAKVAHEVGYKEAHDAARGGYKEAHAALVATARQTRLAI